MTYLASFLIGATPFAVLIPWALYRIDVRNYGSKNPGSTNVYRTISQLQGKRKAIMVTAIVALLDLGKGIMPALINAKQAPISCLFAVLGHIYSPFLGFSGGKGVATFLGSFVGATMNPIFALPPALWAFTTFNDSILKMLRLNAEWIKIGPIKIKKSFVVSLAAMLISLIIFMLITNNFKIQLSYLAVFALILWQHAEYLIIT